MKKDIGCFVLFILVLLAGTGCRKSDPVAPGTTESRVISLKAEPASFLSVNDISVFADSCGKLYNWDETIPFFKKNSTNVYVWTSGLWIGLDNNPPQINPYIGGFNNYSSRWDTLSLGVFHLTSDIINKDITNWPANFGAPVDQNGKPVMFGDEMLLSFLHGTKRHTLSLYNNPVRDLRVTQAVFAYRRSDLRNILFIRYELKNTGNTSLNNIYAGYYSDSDVYEGSLKNSIGFDQERGISYTYISPGSELLESVDSCISGFFFLESPVNEIEYPNFVSSHRIMYRNHGPTGSQFGELSLRAPSEGINALKGLGMDGSSMINPVSKEITKFAFTGDPLLRTGWLDYMWDARNIINTGPFNLMPGENKVITVGWIIAEERELKTNLNKIRAQKDLISKDRSLWHFPASRY